MGRFTCSTEQIVLPSLFPKEEDLGVTGVGTAAGGAWSRSIFLAPWEAASCSGWSVWFGPELQLGAE